MEQKIIQKIVAGKSQPGCTLTLAIYWRINRAMAAKINPIKDWISSLISMDVTIWFVTLFLFESNMFL